MRPSHLLVALLAAGALGPTPPVGAEPAGILVGCDRSAERVEITADAVLDPSCTYTGGFDITASGVVFDCRGARISGPTSSGRGIEIRTPVDVALRDVTVRGCTVDGFLNSIRITRTGFRTLPAGEEFEHPTERIVIEDNQVGGSRGVGIYVDGYVSGVTIRDNVVAGAGSSGIYLETGSKGTEVADNLIVDNGFVENGPDGRPFDLGGTTVWFWGVGREGLSVDGSYENLIRDNTFRGNSAGGIFLYKNCGEYPDRNPERWFERRDPAARNVIEGNRFEGGRNGVWVGSRMGENVLPMECSDPRYVEEPGRHLVLDRAPDNTVRANEFEGVTYPIRVEDDGTIVEGNQISSSDPDHHGVIVGTPHRTDVLGRPVQGTVLRGNRVDVAGNDSPYRWVHGHVGTTQEGNLALGRSSSLCEGQPLPRQLFVMTIAVAPALPDGSAPPTPDLTVDELGALPSCRSELPSAPVTAPPPSAPLGATPATPIAGSPSYTG